MDLLMVSAKQKHKQCQQEQSLEKRKIYRQTRERIKEKNREKNREIERKRKREREGTNQTFAQLSQEQKEENVLLVEKHKEN